MSNLFGPPNPGKPELIEKIRRRISQVGGVTFAEFMEMALYDPDYGYYTSDREPVGTGGDYLTSPTMHPAFGACVARWLDGRWREMGSPAQFDVVEMGAGKGLLSLSVLIHAREHLPELASAMRYRVVEKAAVRLLQGEECKVDICESLSQIPDGSVAGCLLSNELVDAFPVHLVTTDGGRLREIYVSLQDDRFIEVIDEPSTDALPKYFERLGVSPPEGYRTEINLRALEWMEEVGSKLRKGFVLTIDYGYPAQEYYSPERRRGTLLCYYRHTFSEDPYIRVGLQDITAHVDFTSLMDAGREEGLETTAFTTQREFLLEQGIEDFATETRARRAILPLIDPQAMGRFGVLEQAKRGCDAG